MVKAFFALISLALFPVLAYVYPTQIRQRRLNYVYLMEDDEAPRRGVRRVTYHYAIDDREVINRAYLVASETGLVAFSPVCTHLGCFVNWDSNKQEFICPCHGGKYNVRGQVISGPPSRPLTQLPLRVDSGKIFIGVTL